MVFFTPDSRTRCDALTHTGMAGKITDEMIFDAERRSKLSETIVGAMTEEERSNPDLIVATV